MINRREFIETSIRGAAAATLAGLLPRTLCAEPPVKPAAGKPNIIIVLADDLGWRDTSYQGSPYAKTPHIDEMAAHSVRFDYFYAAQQMCSPGRFGILTGRAPFRCGLSHLGSIRPKEITMAEALKTAGYSTGLFGKWHLGCGGPNANGFDKAIGSHNFFDIGDTLRDSVTKENHKIEGDGSVFVTDLALDWIREQAEARTPFFAYVSFGSPHVPHIGAEEFKEIYRGIDFPAKTKGSYQDFYAEISGIDAAVGKLRAALREMGIADNTLVWFTSDNGGICNHEWTCPPDHLGKMKIGALVPALLEWPARIKQPMRTDCGAVHMDMYPTIMEIVGVQMPNQPVIDGISLVPLLEGKMKRREKPMGFLQAGVKPDALSKIDFVKDTGAVWIEGAYRLEVATPGKKSTNHPKPRLIDIYADPAHETDLAAKEPERVARMMADLNTWRQSVRDSFDGKDYVK